MNNKLSKEYVLHVAELAKLHVSDDDVVKYQEQLKCILDEINKIKEVDIDNNIMISPSDNKNVFSTNKEPVVNTKEFVSNALESVGNFVKVGWGIDE